MNLQSDTLSSLLTIWTAPRRTIRRIVDSDPGRLVVLLSALTGLVSDLSAASSQSFGDRYSLTVVFLMIVIGGPLSGILSLYLMGALMQWTGSWLGGEATAEEVRAAYAWSAVPMISTLLLWIPRFALGGTGLFTTASPLEAYPILLGGIEIVEGVIGIWMFVILLKCLGEVHRYSAWKALLSLILSLLILLISISCLVVLYLRFA